MSHGCRYLPWDSEFFDCRIARLESNRLTAPLAAAADIWCQEERIDCLYLLADADDAETVRQAERHGYNLVDIRVTLDTHLGEARQAAGVSGNAIRTALPSDIPALKAAAGKNHQDSRFYFDQHFPASRCDALYETWIERSCAEYADAVLVAERNGQVAGYISCHRNPDGGGQIGLVGVAPQFQGQRLGPLLLEAALDWFFLQGIRQVTVVTQGRNARAQRLYQKYGFLTASVQLWYHKWFNAAEGSTP